ncbi:hypothetical protein CPLU01_15696 [Colletotrichum plurivorum]|uniref:AAA+ ATPase domain-containing protein n=1 Tax=Colletotrichum plurivorum TaxID=2175906 RepID=A0A8H6J8S8_9PEZI|nr:hypothetical protein CPLU01_15696 [Colletotrichum plurivorum]
MQLMLLEQQNKKRLMMEREGVGLGTEAEPSTTSAPDAQTEKPTPQDAANRAHYTISEDEIGKGLEEKFAALAYRSNIFHSVEASELSHHPKQDPEQASRQQQNTTSGTQRSSSSVSIPSFAPVPFTRNSQRAPASGLGPLAQQWRQFERSQSDIRRMQGDEELSQKPGNLLLLHDNAPQSEPQSAAKFEPEPTTHRNAGSIGLVSATYSTRGLQDIARNTIELEDSGMAPSIYARSPVSNPKKYVEKNPNVAFIVYKVYSQEHQQSAVDEALKSNQPLPCPEPARQDVLLISDEIVQGMKATFESHPKLRREFPEVRDKKLMAPYIWWYHCRKSIDIGSLPHHHAKVVGVLINWIEENYGAFYDKIDDQFRRNRVSNDSLEFFFRPSQVLVSVADDVPQGFLATTRPVGPTRIETQDSEEGEPAYQSRWKLPLRSYSYFNGEFMRNEEDREVSFMTDTKDGEADIRSLSLIPLEYASQTTQETLFRRGKTFWKCRNKRLISYEGTTTGRKEVGGRFMIDYDTYKSFHPYSHYSSHAVTPSEKRPDLPKDGIDLEVDKIHDVSWNELAFNSLVADQDMKTLILALVTNQLEAEKGTDVIENKGNGLILLLHGSPGTGKTFTAESVAEVAKKPLYPVTCGDIGTEPEAVEKYLESVFYLGKLWDCVVLLDEAEVFLEQRTLQDLKRNALVSIFLRALEYYDGILILTTNRVGTFDEAFKSRIQLALRYERLKDYQRKQIWRNFFDRLRALGEKDNIDFDNISLHMDELARHPMNGRQIRNSITTARQLAKYMKTRMVFSHLQRTIAITDKFDQYLADVREGDVEESGGRGEAAASLSVLDIKTSAEVGHVLRMCHGVM